MFNIPGVVSFDAGAAFIVFWAELFALPKTLFDGQFLPVIRSEPETAKPRNAPPRV
jgi:hypothetical protein